MIEAVDRVLNSYVNLHGLDDRSRNEVRAKITTYLATLFSAGQKDADQLTEYGLAYLRQLLEGPDYSRYTGC